MTLVHFDHFNETKREKEKYNRIPKTKAPESKKKRPSAKAPH